MARTRNGDMNAYDELYRRHLPDARRVARIVTDDRDEVDDVVAEAFTRLLDRLQRGGCPDSQLTPYLRTIIRRLAVDRYRQSSRDGHPADPELLDVLPSPDDDIHSATERYLMREAFEMLPERWQRVLWHTEIEGRAATTLAPSLASSANAVAALAYRAREGLRQAYFEVHLSSQMPAQCKEYAPKLAPYIRETLPQAEDVGVAIHLDVCTHCREQRDEMLLLVADVRALLAPALLGTMAVTSEYTITAGFGAGAVTASGGSASGAGGYAEGGDGLRRLVRLRPRGVVQVATTSVVSAAAAAAVAFAAVSAMSPAPLADDHTAAPPPATSPYTPATSSSTSAAPQIVQPAATPEQTAGDGDDEGETDDGRTVVAGTVTGEAGADDADRTSPSTEQSRDTPPATDDGPAGRGRGNKTRTTPPANDDPTAPPGHSGSHGSANHTPPGQAPEPEPEPEVPDTDADKPDRHRDRLLCRVFPRAFPSCT